MALIEREAAIAALPEMAEFRPVFMEAWDEWLSLPVGFRAKMSSGARAYAVHDLIVDSAIRAFGSAVRLVDKAKLKLFLFGDICVRFKKHDRDLAPSNQPTKQVKAFLGQEQLEGVPAIYNLEAGYILDPSETEVIGTNLVCPNGHLNKPLWAIDLYDEGYQYEVTDLFDPGNANRPDNNSEEGSRWKQRESGVIIPFKRTPKGNDKS